jgi:hypothetical protein
MPADRLEQSGLNRAWITAEAALPIGWQIRALLLTDGDEWLATARGPEDGQRAEALGSYPEQALRLLADELRRLREPANG